MGRSKENKIANDHSSGKRNNKTEKRQIGIFQLTLLLLALTSLLTSGLLVGTWIIDQSSDVSKQIKALPSDKLQEQVDKLKDEIRRTNVYLEYKSQDTIIKNTQQAKEEALDYLEKIRFGNDGYIFVNTYDGNSLIFDGKKLETPVQMKKMDYPDELDFYSIEMELASTSGGGYFQYNFKKIGDTIPTPKISYVLGFDHWQWIIGAGDYLDNFENEIIELKSNLKSDLKTRLLLAGTLFLIIIFIMIFISFLIAGALQKQFNNLLVIINKSKSKEDLTRNSSTIAISDLRNLASDFVSTKEFAVQFGEIIEQSNNEIYIFAQDTLKIIHANKGALNNTAYEINELIGMNFLHLNPELSLSEFEKYCIRIEETESQQLTYESFHKRKDESIYPTEVRLTHSFYDQNKVFVAFINDITERKFTEYELQLSRQRYSSLFENAPISLWEEDFSEVMNYLKNQLITHNTSLEILFETHPEILQACSSLAKVIDVNTETLRLYEASTKEELIGNLNKTFSEKSYHSFKETIIALYNGKTTNTFEAKNLSLKGKDLDILFRWTLLESKESMTKRVILSANDITELRMAEKEISLSQSRFRALFMNNHTVMVLINPDNGKFIDVNPACLDFYGYSYEKFITELTIYDLHYRDKNEVSSDIGQAKTRTRSYFKFKHKLSSGEERDVEVYSGPIHVEGKDALFSIIHDISEKEIAIKSLVETKNKMESIFRAAPTGIGVVSKRVFQEVNQKFCELTGYSKEELIGEKSSILYLSKKEFERVGTEKYDQIKETGTGAVETRFKRKDGKIIDILLNSTPIDLNDYEAGVTFTALDITENRKILRELENQQMHLEETVIERTGQLEASQTTLLKLVDDLNLQSERLKEANNQLALKNKELETFTYSVSHDLKAPLRGIDGYSQLLLENHSNSLDNEGNTFLHNIVESSAQMNRLIEDLLTYSRMERKEFEKEFLSPEKLLQPILSNYSNIIDTKKVDIKLNFAPQFTMMADRDGLSMIIRNLVDNALKFCSNAEKPKIEIGGQEYDTYWEIYVKDNGIGFDMKFHDKLFLIFQRLHLPEEYPGTGIGLAMVSKAINRMNGEIYAKSALGKGAVFFIKIFKTN